MFDSNTYIKQNIENNVHQVSGSLIKTHPDSVFINFARHSRSEDRVFSPKPYYIDDKDKEYTCVVLQVMLIENGYLCEVILERNV